MTPDDSAQHEDDYAFDPALLIDVAGQYLFDGGPTLTQTQVAAQAGRHPRPGQCDVAVPRLPGGR